MNISKLTGGKNEKVRRGVLHEKLLDFCLDFCFDYRKQWMETEVTEYVIHRQEAF